MHVKIALSSYVPSEWVRDRWVRPGNCDVRSEPCHDRPVLPELLEARLLPARTLAARPPGWWPAGFFVPGRLYVLVARRAAPRR